MSKQIIVLLVVVFLAISTFFIVKPKKTVINPTPKVENIVQREKILVIGTVGEIPKDEVKEYKPFIDYVAKKLSSEGIVKGEVVVASSPAEMSKFIRQDKVDLYIDSPFPIYVVAKLAEAHVLADRWKKGEEKYHSIIFTRKDSGIKTLNDLKGKTIAFEGPYSTSGYFLPKAELLKLGFKLREKKGANDVIGKDEIGYYFTNDQEKVTLDVLNGKAIAGGQNQRDVEDASGEKMSELTKIFQSIDLYRHIIVTRKGLSSSLHSKLEDVLIQMNTDPEGIEVLNNFKKTTKFGIHKDPNEVFVGLKELTSLVESEIIRQ